MKDNGYCATDKRKAIFIRDELEPRLDGLFLGARFPPQALEPVALTIHPTFKIALREGHLIEQVIPTAMEDIERHVVVFLTEPFESSLDNCLGPIRPRRGKGLESS